MVIPLALAVLSSSHSAPLPTGCSGNYKKNNPQHQKILDDVKPIYGPLGFINVIEVRKKFNYHVDELRKNPSDTDQMLRALAWLDLAMSDGNVFESEQAKENKRFLKQRMLFWPRKVDSFQFVRTFAITTYITGSPDMFVENRFLEKLYAHNQQDSELELIYLLWANMNRELTPNRLTVERLLQKQERIQFRKGARKQIESACYRYHSTNEGKHVRDLQESLRLKQERYKLLPPGHVDLRSDRKKAFQETVASLEAQIKRWNNEK